MPLKIPLSMNFGGKTYIYEDAFRTKEGAERSRESLRSKGATVMIVDRGTKKVPRFIVYATYGR